MNYERELEFACRLAKAAGENARLTEKENGLMVRGAIEREFPDDGILGEEGSSRSGSSRRRWIIDPIDGTRDFVWGD